MENFITSYVYGTWIINVIFQYCSTIINGYNTGEKYIHKKMATLSNLGMILLMDKKDPKYSAWDKRNYILRNWPTNKTSSKKLIQQWYKCLYLFSIFLFLFALKWFFSISLSLSLDLQCIVCILICLCLIMIKNIMTFSYTTDLVFRQKALKKVLNSKNVIILFEIYNSFDIKC